MSETAPSGDQPSQMAHLKRHKLGSLTRDNVPSVHGRPNTTLNAKARLSNHQRNLSLDFRQVHDSIFGYFLIIAAFNVHSLCTRAPLCHNLIANSFIKSEHCKDKLLIIEGI